MFFGTCAYNLLISTSCQLQGFMIINSMKKFNGKREREKIQHLVFFIFLVGFSEVLKHAGRLFQALIRISHILI